VRGFGFGWSGSYLRRHGQWRDARRELHHRLHWRPVGQAEGAIRHLYQLDVRHLLRHLSTRGLEHRKRASASERRVMGWEPHSVDTLGKRCEEMGDGRFDG
jgi:hypothetical protein